ncbi:MAG: ABC transporter ATP-binding protein [Caldilineaceae bacterium]
MSTDIILETKHLTIGYRHAGRADVVVSHDLDLRLRRGELVCLLGPNGAGKSTLMRTLAGLQPALGGSILLDGDAPGDLTAREMARRLSIVLTERVDVGNLSAQELVALGRHPYTDWWGNLTPHDEEVVRWAVRAVGAGALAERPILELSDGERQKVMIARALAQEPLLILLDEPTAFLDLPRRVEVMGLLRALARHTGRAILLRPTFCLGRCAAPTGSGSWPRTVKWSAVRPRIWCSTVRLSASSPVRASALIPTPARSTSYAKARASSCCTPMACPLCGPHAPWSAKVSAWCSNSTRRHRRPSPRSPRTQMAVGRSTSTASTNM